MNLLFIQDFPLSAKGGGAVIYKRLLGYSQMFNVDVVVAYDINSYGLGAAGQYKEIPFQTRSRKLRFGFGRISAICTLLGFDNKARKSISDIIKNTSPSAVHLTAHGISLPVAAYSVKKAKVPYYLTVHDIWELTVSNIPKWIARRIFKGVIKEAEMVFVISLNMGEYLKKEYGIKDYRIIHDGIPTNNVIKTKRMSSDGTIRLLYVGLLHEMQKEILFHLIDTMGKLPDVNFEIHLFTSLPFSHEKSYDNVKILNHGWVDEIELKKISDTCDYGLLPLSFNKGDELFYRTSLMTKIPFYVGADLPIFCIGPSSASAVQIIEEHKIGYTLTVNDTAKISNAVTKLIRLTNNEYQELINNLGKSRKTTFNLDLLAESFYTTIIDMSTK